MEMLLKEKTEPSFFVDAMLGNIAKKMRLMGYDVKYSSNIEDDELIRIAKNEKRVIISRDGELIRKGLRTGIKSIFLKNQKEIEQLKEIVNKLNLKLIEINGEKARCPKCNSKTQSIMKKNIHEIFPNKILELNDKFWQCKFCDQIFWEGTHIKNLQKIVSELNEK
ncbi:MAG: Mut7-C RNAse domain-containing protein [Nitrosopumilus sp.]|nr:Mut7-C RNAse domain-containing protein [Nitrosopumilus sp.]MDH3385467.1 Mut7-C RNAse domain-containing protein [Nitrosopumilus sp.]